MCDAVIRDTANAQLVELVCVCVHRVCLCEMECLSGSHAPPITRFVSQTSKTCGKFSSKTLKCISERER